MEKNKCRCHDFINIIYNYNSYFSRTLKFSPEKRANTPNGKHYHFIPAGNLRVLLNQFEELMHTFKDHKPKFVDCGCGVGNIVMLANQVGYACSGIEFDHDTYKVAKELVGHGSTIYRGDITRHEYYSQYDLIYFYVPIHNNRKMKMFIRKIMKHSKVGAILYSYGGAYATFVSQDKRFKKIKLKHDSGSTAFKKVKE